MLLNLAFETFIFAASAGLTALLIILLHPYMKRYAMARPNARSSHRVPTPQGGGIAVICAVAVLITLAALRDPSGFRYLIQFVPILGAALALAAVGAVDDIRIIEPMPRLLLQTGAVLVVLAALPSELRIVPAAPWWLERALLLIGLVWFVNLVNFMDGLDWMTVAEVVPVTAALVIFAHLGALPEYGNLAALTLCGAMLGFAPFNKPVARLFLGDVGSLPIGLLLGWLLILLAAQHLAAALLLPLYYLADSTITLLRRLLRGERITQAHRSHYYQQAIDHGLSVPQVVGCVALVNVVLAGLAAATLSASVPVQMILLTSGSIVVAILLAGFSYIGRWPTG